MSRMKAAVTVHSPIQLQAHATLTRLITYVFTNYLNQATLYMRISG